MTRLWAVLLGAVASPMAFSAPPGVVTERPAEGRYVEVAGAFLVPHVVVIPGSDVSFHMEPIPGGPTELTNPDGGETIRVELAPYWIGRCEVTWAEYRQYMNLCAVFERFDDARVRPVNDANRVDAITAPSKLYDPGFTFDSGDSPALPAVSMTQYAAKQYTKWLSLLTGDFYRLPSEAEWEHACRAGREGAYAFGEDRSEIDAHGWHEDNSDWATQPVGGKLPNAWGLYDMHGNASEWVLDAPRRGAAGRPRRPRRRAAGSLADQALPTCAEGGLRVPHGGRIRNRGPACVGRRDLARVRPQRAEEPVVVRVRRRPGRGVPDRARTPRAVA